MLILNRNKLKVEIKFNATLTKHGWQTRMANRKWHLLTALIVSIIY